MASRNRSARGRIAAILRAIAYDEPGALMGSVNVYNVKDYGAVGNDTTDDSAAIQAAINAAVAETASQNAGRYHNMGSTVYFPRGTYRMNSTVDIAGARGLQLVAEGGTAILNWRGAANQPMFTLDGYRCLFEGLWFMSATQPAASAVKLWNNVAGGWIATANTFERCIFGGYHTNQFTNCIDITNSGAVGDNNNEMHVFRGCEFSSYTNAGIRIWGSQVHGIVVEDCQLFGGSVGQYGVHCEYGSMIHVRGGTGGYHTGADFYFENFYLVATIDGWNSEGSARMVTAGTATGSAFPVTITGCRFESLNVHADGRVVKISTAGPTTIIGNMFRGVNVNPRIYIHGYTDTRVLTMIGNTFRGPDAYPTTMTVIGSDNVLGAVAGGATGLHHVYDLGNQYFDPGSGNSYHRAHPIRVNVGGLTRSMTASPLNFMGRVQFASNESSKAVALSPVEADASYDVIATVESGQWDCATDLTVQVKNKTANGFDLVLNKAPGPGHCYINWMLVRR